MKIFLLILFSLISIGAFAEEPPHIPKGHLIEILNYDFESQTYAVADLKFSGQGPFFTTPKQLADNIENFDLEKALRRPRSIEKRQFVLRSDLKIIYEDDRQKIAQFLKANRKKNRPLGQ